MSIDILIKLIGSFVLILLFFIPNWVFGAKLVSGENEGLVFIGCTLAIVGEFVALVSFFLHEIM